MEVNDEVSDDDLALTNSYFPSSIAISTKINQDIKDIEANELPTSFRYLNQTGDVHLNEYGYDFLAHCVYNKGKELGYFK